MYMYERCEKNLKGVKKPAIEKINYSKGKKYGKGEKEIPVVCTT